MPDRHTHRVGAWAVAFVGLSCTVSVECRDSMDTPPHIVMVLGDDIGFGDVGYVDAEVISPTLDALALGGVRLGRMYSYMWCAPSRGALMTGRYPQHTGVYWFSGADYALNETFQILPEMLSKAGYTSHAVGKWHLGMAEARYLPESRGFASYLGYLDGGEDYYYHDNLGPGATRPNASGSGNGSWAACPMHWRQDTTCTDKSVPGVTVLGFATTINASGCCAACAAHTGCGAWTYRPIPHNNCLLANRATEPRASSPGMACGSVAPLPPPAPTSGCYYRDLWRGDATEDDGPATDSSDFPRYSTFVFAERAVSIITAHDVNKGPLFLYLPLQSAHSPLEVPEEYLKRYKSYDVCLPFRRGQVYACAGPGGGGQYCACNRMVVSAMVTAMDDVVANITAALERRGMWQNTVLVFSGDNGGPQMLSHWNAGLRGGKWTFFEGGIRPAAFIASPRLPPSARGQWWNGTIHMVDWAATFVALAGLTPVDGIDGVNQWDAIAAAGGHLPPLVPRNETLITGGIVVVGKWKLATVSLGGYGECGAMGRQGWDCLLGTGGGWVPRLPAGDVGNNTNMCPTLVCSNVSGGVDGWLCSDQCNMSHPCLYDVESDAEERVNLATQLPDVVAELTAVLERLNSTVVPPYGKFNGSAADKCSAYLNRWGYNGVPYFGPWLPTA